MWGHKSSQHVETDPKWQQLHGGSCGNCLNLNVWLQLPHPAGVKAWNKNILTALSNMLFRPRKWTGWSTVSLTQTHPRERRLLGQTFTRLCLELFVSAAPECKPLLHPKHMCQIYSYWNNLSGSLISSPPNLLVTSNTLQHALLIPTRGELTSSWWKLPEDNFTKNPGKRERKKTQKGCKNWHLLWGVLTEWPQEACLQQDI